MKIRGLNEKDKKYIQTLITNPLQTRPFFMNTVYKKPRGITLERANKLLVTFVIIRHPFNRLVSGYNDKIKYKFWNSSGILPNIGKVIYDTLVWSRNLSELQMKEKLHYPTPKEFVAYLLYKATNDDNTISVKHLNRHWRPQYAVCPFCEISFDFVGDIHDNDYHLEFLSNLLNFNVRDFNIIHCF
jgi:hypothetical protein